jgi:chromosome segregation ATPase
MENREVIELKKRCREQERHIENMNNDIEFAKKLFDRYKQDAAVCINQIGKLTRRIEILEHSLQLKDDLIGTYKECFEIAKEENNRLHEKIKELKQVQKKEAPQTDICGAIVKVFETDKFTNQLTLAKI